MRDKGSQIRDIPDNPGWVATLAIADRWHDAFRGQSRSPNVVPFDVLGMVSY